MTDPLDTLTQSEDLTETEVPEPTRGKIGRKFTSRNNPKKKVSPRSGYGFNTIAVPWYAVEPERAAVVRQVPPAA